MLSFIFSDYFCVLHRINSADVLYIDTIDASSVSVYEFVLLVSTEFKWQNNSLQ